MARVEVVGVVVVGVVVARVLMWCGEAPLAHTQSRRRCRQSGVCGVRNPAGRGWRNQGRGDWVGMLSLLCPGEGGGTQAEWDAVGM